MPNRSLRPLAPVLLTLALALALVLGGCEALEEAVDLAGRERERRTDAQDVRPDDPLLEAAFRGDSAAVRAILDSGKDAKAHLAARDPAGMTALHRATWGGHPGIVALLLERGADPDEPDAGGQTPVSLAARWGRGDIMALLLAKGGDVTQTDDLGRGPLHWAAHYGHLDVMRALLAHGLPVDAPAKTGTPLHSAMSGGQIEAGRLLLDKGAGLETKDDLGWTPLLVACGTDSKHATRAECAAFLIGRGADVEARSREGTSALVLAAIDRDSLVTAMLLARGAKPVSATKDTPSALRSAVESKAPAVMRQLLAAGADPNQAYAPPKRQRLVHRAAMMDTAIVLQVLLAAGADADVTDDGQQTPLHLAAYHGRPEVVQALLGARVTVDARDKSRRTPLIVACAQNKVETVRLLLAAGADASARDAGGETPTKAAWGPERAPIRALLAQAGATR